MTWALVGRDKHNINSDARITDKNSSLGRIACPHLLGSLAERFRKHPACYSPRCEFARPRYEYSPVFPGI